MLAPPAFAVEGGVTRGFARQFAGLVVFVQGRQCGGFSDKLLQSGTFWAEIIRSNAATGAIKWPAADKIAACNGGNNHYLLG
jgi:hypothetical protein